MHRVGEPPSSRRLQAGAPEPRAWGLHWEGDPPGAPRGRCGLGVSAVQRMPRHL